MPDRRGLVPPAAHHDLEDVIDHAAVAAFSLAITARDGLWALLAFAFTTVSIAWLVSLAL